MNTTVTMSTTTTATTAVTTTATTSGSEATLPPAIIGSPDIVVSTVCKQALPGSPNTCLAVFSYDNPTGSPMTIPVGANNLLSSGAPTGEWPTIFAAGTWYGAVAHQVACNESVTWTVTSGSGSSSATAAAGETSCPAIPV